MQQLQVLDQMRIRALDASRELANMEVEVELQRAQVFLTIKKDAEEDIRAAEMKVSNIESKIFSLEGEIEHLETSSSSS